MESDLKTEEALEGKKKRVLVVVFGYFGAEHSDIREFAKVYKALNSDSSDASIETVQFRLPMRALFCASEQSLSINVRSEIMQPLESFLAHLSSNQKAPVTHIIFHILSNGGAIPFATMVYLLSQRETSVEYPQLLNSNVCGIIYDSAPTTSHTLLQSYQSFKYAFIKQWQTKFRLSSSSLSRLTALSSSSSSNNQSQSEPKKQLRPKPPPKHFRRRNAAVNWILLKLRISHYRNERIDRMLALINGISVMISDVTRQYIIPSLELLLFYVFLCFFTLIFWCAIAPSLRSFYHRSNIGLRLSEILLSLKPFRVRKQTVAHQLFLYSKNDSIAPIDEIETHLKQSQKKSKGRYLVRGHNFDLSDHLQHLSEYEAIYQRFIHTFVKLCIQ